MNNDRRKALTALRGKLEELKSVLEDKHSGDADTLHDEEQDYFDNMPESFQQGDRGQAAEAAADAIESAKDSIDEAVSALETAINWLEEAAGE